MPQFNRAELDRKAREYGFVRDTFEKVLRLKYILDFVNQHEYLKEHLLLKGGTAINLTIFNLPRLSVDIDMDYTPNDSRDVMLKSRARITELLVAYMRSEGYSLSPSSKYYYSLDAFHYSYVNAAGNPDMIKIEINYSLRAHVLESDSRSLTTDAFGEKMQIRTVAPVEIFAAKANALLSRAAPRDLYDFDNMIRRGLFSDRHDDLRKCIVFYAAISAETINKSFSTEAMETITFQRVRRELFPVLNQEERAREFDVLERIGNVKRYLDSLMMLSEGEREFLDRFENNEYRPELVFCDEMVVKRIKDHPMAVWKTTE